MTSAAAAIAPLMSVRRYSRSSLLQSPSPRQAGQRQRFKTKPIASLMHPSVLVVVMAYALAYVEHLRGEPAAGDTLSVSDLNGWLPSAECCCLAI